VRRSPGSRAENHAFSRARKSSRVIFAAMLASAERVMSEFDPAGTIVNIGATPEGIGAVYELAKPRVPGAWLANGAG